MCAGSRKQEQIFEQAEQAVAEKEMRLNCMLSHTRGRILHRAGQKAATEGGERPRERRFCRPVYTRDNCNRQQANALMARGVLSLRVLRTWPIVVASRCRELLLRSRRRIHIRAQLHF